MASQLEQDLKAQLMAALKAKDAQTASTIRMITTKVMEKTTSGTNRVEVTDDLVREVISAYRKSMEKAKAEFAGAGDKAAEQIAQLDFEIAWCKRMLPQELSEAELRAAVEAAVAQLPTKDPKQAGRVVGALKKQFGDRVDANLAKQLAETLLQG